MSTLFVSFFGGTGVFSVNGGVLRFLLSAFCCWVGVLFCDSSGLRFRLLIVLLVF